ncbi:hypothetical protein GCM10012284_51670 [Mangrovihabitans endophyticus]|uniref:Alcohol dehydrogenase-like N-terminal domain-containing protein n=1 Tax=Mangrovihabitans endophyticus TaxID=1751298 RepID=A0A8J3C543_9ACTN|nr:hypothetical protein GCM10012284_51670 [Mangrovihabitans endophyticus]
MKAVSIQTFGDPDGMVVIDAPMPAPGPGQLLIDVRTIGVGGVDAVIRRGTLRGHGFHEGIIPGSEVAGRVIAAGDPADAAWVGRDVWAFTGVGGAYAEQVVSAYGSACTTAYDRSCRATGRTGINFDDVE